MTTLRLAAAFLLIYALALAFNAALYISWSGDSSELTRVLVRIAGVALVSAGLWQAKRWAWWIAVVAGGVLLALGVLGVITLVRAGIIDSRPYPVADYLFFAISLGTLLGSVLCLLLPKSRGAIRVTR